jgi:hypothetical protein
MSTNNASLMAAAFSFVSLIRLHIYGFHRFNKRESRDYGSYHHDNFIRGQEANSFHMVRTKIKGPMAYNTVHRKNEPNFYAVRKATTSCPSRNMPSLTTTTTTTTPGDTRYGMIPCVPVSSSSCSSASLAGASILSPVLGTNHVQWNLINEIANAAGGYYHFIPPRRIQDITSSKPFNMMPTRQQQQQQREEEEEEEEEAVQQQSTPDIHPFQHQLLCLSTRILPLRTKDTATANDTTSTPMMLHFKHHNILPAELGLPCIDCEEDGNSCSHSDFFQGRRFFFVDE